MKQKLTEIKGEIDNFSNRQTKQLDTRSTTK